MSLLPSRGEPCQKERLTDWGLYALYELLSLKFDRLETKIQNVMSKISEFATAQQGFNAKLSTAVDGLTADIQTLNDKITELQNSQGTVSPEDQALLDELQAQGQAIADKLEALDNLTPPTVPPNP